MPQLDQVTFFSQYFWLCFFFLTFYLFLYKHFLPKMSRILKYRKRKVELSQQGMSRMEQENEKAGASYQTLLFSGFSNSSFLFDTACKQVDFWLSQVVEKSNNTQLSSSNKNYIESLGEKALSTGVAVSHPFAVFPPNLLISSLLKSGFSFTLTKTKHTPTTKVKNAQSKAQQSKSETTTKNNKSLDQTATDAPHTAEKPATRSSYEKNEKVKKKIGKKR